MHGTRDCSAVELAPITGQVALDSRWRYYFWMDEQLKADGAQHEHVESFARQAFPRSDFDHALLAYLALRARHGADGIRDGRRSAMVATFNGRATWDAIRQWRRGVARAPQWAWDMLDKKMAARQDQLAHGRQFSRRSA